MLYGAARALEILSEEFVRRMRRCEVRSIPEIRVELIFKDSAEAPR